MIGLPDLIEIYSKLAITSITSSPKCRSWPPPPPPPHMVHGGTRSRGRTVATYIDLIGEKDGYKITLSSCLM